MVTVELARRLRDARLRNVLGDHLVALLHGAGAVGAPWHSAG